MKTLDKLKIGEQGVIVRIMNSDIAPKLLEMGCTTGENVKLQHIAPMGCPIAIEISGYILSMRMAEAKQIEII